MKIEALISFCGVLSMAKGEVREYSDKAILADLLSAGYVRDVGTEPKKKTKTAIARSVKRDEGQRD